MYNEQAVYFYRPLMRNEDSIKLNPLSLDTIIPQSGFLHVRIKELYFIANGIHDGDYVNYIYVESKIPIKVFYTYWSDIFVGSIYSRLVRTTLSSEYWGSEYISPRFDLPLQYASKAITYNLLATNANAKTNFVPYGDTRNGLKAGVSYNLELSTDSVYWLYGHGYSKKMFSTVKAECGQSGFLFGMDDMGFVWGNIGDIITTSGRRPLSTYLQLLPTERSSRSYLVPLWRVPEIMEPGYDYAGKWVGLLCTAIQPNTQVRIGNRVHTLQNIGDCVVDTVHRTSLITGTKPFQLVLVNENTRGYYQGIPFGLEHAMRAEGLIFDTIWANTTAYTHQTIRKDPRAFAASFQPIGSAHLAFVFTKIEGRDSLYISSRGKTRRLRYVVPNSGNAWVWDTFWLKVGVGQVADKLWNPQGLLVQSNFTSNSEMHSRTLDSNLLSFGTIPMRIQYHEFPKLSVRMAANGEVNTSLGGRKPIYRFCAGSPVNFRSITEHYPPTRIRWEFGGGDTATVVNPVRIFKDTGRFSLRLIAFRQERDCEGRPWADTLVVPYEVYAAPALQFARSQNLCAGDTASLRVSADRGPLRVQWEASPALSCLQCPAPKAWPDSTSRFVFRTTYRDCAVRPDTLTVKVSRPLQLSTSFDSLLCNGNAAKLKVLPSGGLDSGYRYFWNGNEGADSLQTPLLTGDTAWLFTLRHGCNDSLNHIFNLKVLPALRAQAPSDTLLCRQVPVWLRGTSGGGSAFYPLQGRWAQQAPGDSLQLMPQQDTTLYWIAYDGCSREDTAAVRVHLRSPLRWQQTPRDTLLCRNDSLRVSWQTSGADSSAHAWTLTGPSISLIGITTPGFVSWLRPGTYRMTLFNACEQTVLRDTLHLFVPAPELLGGWQEGDTFCPGRQSINLNLSADASLAIEVAGNRVYNARVSAGINPINLTLPEGNHRLLFTADDGCGKIDSNWREVVVRQSVRWQLPSTTSYCAGERWDGELFPGTGAVSQTWYWNDRAVSNNTSYSRVLDSSGTIRLHYRDACTDTQHTQQVKVMRAPQGVYRFHPALGCAPDTLHWQVPAVNESGSWELSDGLGNMFTLPAGAANLQSMPYASAGSYRLGWKLQMAGRTCFSGDTLVELYPRPRAGFDIRPDMPDKGELVSFEDRSTGSNLTTWRLAGQLATGARFRWLAADTGHYRMLQTVQNIHGCTDSIGGHFYVSLSPLVYLPDALTAGPTGQNPRLQPFVANHTRARLWIYNRWGELLHDESSAGGQVGWTPGPQVPQGVYVLLLELEDRRGRTYRYRSTVTVLR